jgi:putative flippase GtrA
VPGYERLRTRLKAGQHGQIFKKVTLYSAFGVINTLVDYGVFFAARRGFQLPPFVVALRWVAGSFHLSSTETVSLVACNVVAWIVAVTGSYIMNSLVTFGSESGRHLRWRDYFAFFTSGIAAVVTNSARRHRANSLFSCLAGEGGIELR